MQITEAIHAQKMSSWLKNIEISAHIATATEVLMARNPIL
jgi:hypothetical protein